jgi:cold shock CspA family protein
MRYQGRISNWKDDKGYGFVVQNGASEQVFIHIKSFSNRQRRPAGDEIVTYEIITDANGRKRAENVEFVSNRTSNPSAAKGGTFPMKKLIVIILISIVGWQAYGKYLQWNTGHSRQPEAALSGGPLSEIKSKNTATPASFSCDGRTHCSQMTSCEEAYFFLKNCPGVEMDGNHDGEPCEQQWCN